MGGGLTCDFAEGFEETFFGIGETAEQIDAGVGERNSRSFRFAEG
jgi:hypothetical protein